MAKKKTASGGMNRTERVAGTIFFLVYLLVMPLLATRIFDLLEVVLDTTINDSLRNVLYYYTLFAVTVLLFHSYLAHTSGRFLDNLNCWAFSFSTARTNFCSACATCFLTAART